MNKELNIAQQLPAVNANAKQIYNKQPEKITLAQDHIELEQFLAGPM